jgi:hypothetical protein
MRSMWAPIGLSLGLEVLLQSLAQWESQVV